MKSSRWFSTKSVQHLANNMDLAGKVVLVRADFNVPLDKQDANCITDDTRIQAALKTIQFLKSKDSKIVLCSHLGRPKGIAVDGLRLKPVASRLSEYLDQPVMALKDCVGTNVKDHVSTMNNKDVILLENVRFHKQEEKNDQEFAENLATSTTAEIFVNDAFGTAHRAHASTEGVTKFVKHSVAGFLLENEIKYLSGVIENPVKPLTAIIGGAKVSTKLPVLEALIEKCDKILLGGGMIFTFYKALVC